MRHHFHRCSNLRVISIDASDLAGGRKGGSVIVDELCQAKGLSRCVGLADCDILTPSQRRELLVVRVTDLRKQSGGISELADRGAQRSRELAELSEDLVSERDAILEANRRILAEWTAAFELRAEGTPLGTSEDLSSPDLDAHDPAFQASRLDAIDRGLENLSAGDPRYGVCLGCGEPIELARLRQAPDTRVCETCARSVT